MIPRIANLRTLRLSGVAQTWQGPAGALIVDGSLPAEFVKGNERTPSWSLSQSAAVIDEFIEVTAESGECGLFGPVSPGIPEAILAPLRSALIGRRVLAYEDCWEAAFTGERHGRVGHYLIALGAVDCALWDLRGHLMKRPVFELLGGPTRKFVECYASLLGYDPDSHDIENVALAVRDTGFVGQKWALRDGPEQGEAGFARNVARVAKLRRIVGCHHRLMFDALGRWTPSYARAMLREVQRYNVAFIEEPLRPNEMAAYRQLARTTDVPLAAGEHLYSRFEANQMLATEALDVLQPDVAWCGGITEAVKLTVLAESRSVAVMPHGASLVPALHLAMSRPRNMVPAVEYHLTLEPTRQFFFASKFKQDNGRIFLNEHPGLGIELDDARIASRQVCELGA